MLVNSRYPLCPASDLGVPLFFMCLLPETRVRILQRLYVFSLSWIDIDGTKYSHGDIVVIESHLLPVFGEIKDIIADKEHCYYFVCEVMETHQFA